MYYREFIFIKIKIILKIILNNFINLCKYLKK